LIGGTAASAGSQIMAGGEKSAAAQFEQQQYAQQAQAAHRLAAGRDRAPPRPDVEPRNHQAIRAGRGVGSAARPRWRSTTTRSTSRRTTSQASKANYAAKADLASRASILSERKASTSLLAGDARRGVDVAALASAPSRRTSRGPDGNRNRLAGRQQQQAARCWRRRRAACQRRRAVQRGFVERGSRRGRKLAKAGGDYLKVAEHKAQVGYLADQDVEIQRKQIELRNEHANDPAKFDAAWTGYAEGKLAGAEPWAVNHIRATLGSSGNTAYSAILNETRVKTEKPTPRQAGRRWRIRRRTTC
jgi:hypothetical protein